jgi:hypothetical protein
MSWKRFLKDLKRGEIEQVCVLTAEVPSVDAPPDATVNAVASSVSDTPGKHERPEGAEPKSARAERFASQSWEALQASGNPVYALAREYEDVFPDKIPATLPADRGVQHEIDLVPGAKYCVTRQWPLPRDQVQAIDDFFEGRRQAGHVRESISPHSSPTFCVKKATGGWRIVHAFNKLNDVRLRLSGKKSILLHVVVHFVVQPVPCEECREHRVVLGRVVLVHLAVDHFLRANPHGHNGAHLGCERAEPLH